MLVKKYDGSRSAVRVAGAHRRQDTGQWWLLSGTGHAKGEAFVPVPSDPATAGCLLEMYWRRCDAMLGIEGLAAARPGPEAYASFGDFLVAVLLEVGDA
jgi:hypothetical protein